MDAAQKSAAAATRKASEAFTEEERDAVKERAKELKSAGRRRRADKADGERDVDRPFEEGPESLNDLLARDAAT